MNTHAKQTEKKESESNSQAIANGQLESNQSTQFVDNRPEAVTQRKFQEMADSSQQVQQAAQLQAMITPSTVQRVNMEEEEEEVFQGKFKEGGELSFDEPADPPSNLAKVMTQRKALYTSGKSSEPQPWQEPVQKKEQPNNTGLPDQMKTNLESMSGFDMSDVKVHRNSSQPAQLNAHAYAQGTDIHLGPGQEKHLGHEAWHVVQQKQGRVKPTMQMKGKVNVNDDKGLEKEADVMGDKITQGGKSPIQQKLNKSSVGTGNPIQTYRPSTELNQKKNRGLYLPNTDVGKHKYHITPGGIVPNHEEHKNDGNQRLSFEQCAHVTWVRWNGVDLSRDDNQPHMYYEETSENKWSLITGTDGTEQNKKFKEQKGDDVYRQVKELSIDRLKQDKPTDGANPFVHHFNIKEFKSYLENHDTNLDHSAEYHNFTVYKARQAEEARQKAEEARQKKSSINTLVENLAHIDSNMLKWGDDFKGSTETIRKALSRIGDAPDKIGSREKLLPLIDELLLLSAEEKPRTQKGISAKKADIAEVLKKIDSLLRDILEEIPEEEKSSDEGEATEKAKWAKVISEYLEDGKKIIRVEIREEDIEYEVEGGYHEGVIPIAQLELYIE